MLRETPPILFVSSDTLKLHTLAVRADDLNWDYKQDRQALMPNLRKQFVEGGLYFHNHVAAYPVCGHVLF